MNKQPTAGYCLWHRPGRYFRWRVVAEGATEAECTAAMTRHRRNGEYLTLPRGVHPDDRPRQERARLLSELHPTLNITG